MTDSASEPLRPCGFFALRTPLLPISEFTGWSEGIEARRCHERGADVTSAVGRDQRKLRARLRALCARPDVREALRVASTSLYENLHRLENPDAKPGRDVERAVVRYFARMSSRPVPLGLLAGISQGDLADRTDLRLAPRHEYERRSRLSFESCLDVVEALLARRPIRESLLFRPSTDLHRVGGSLRFLTTTGSGPRTVRRLVRLDDSPELDAVMTASAGGARIGDIAARVRETCPQATLGEACAYVDDLVEKRILVAEAQPTPTGGDPLSRIGLALGEIAPRPDEAAAVAAIGSSLSSLDAAGLVDAPRPLDELREHFATICPDRAPRLSVSLLKPTEACRLGHDVVREVAAGLEALRRRTRPGFEGDLASFCRRFARRYGDREVPLAEALDEHDGIGYGAPHARVAPRSAHDADAGAGGRADAAQSHLEEVARDAARRGDRTLVLGEEDIARLTLGEPPPYPDSFDALVTVVGPPGRTVVAGVDVEVVIHGATGPPAFRLLSRHWIDHAGLHRAAVRHASSSTHAHDAAVAAEVVHQPQRGAGDIATRLPLHEHEIPCSVPSTSAATSLPLSDLLVRVQGESVTLRSSRLGRNVTPRITNPLADHAWEVAAFRFFAGLKRHGVANALHWDWGRLDGTPFLPRVRYRRAVLCLAEWRLNAGEIRALRADSSARRFAAVQTLRDRRGLDRLVALRSGERELLIDLDNTLCVDSLVHALADRKDARLVEVYPDPGSSCSTGPEGEYRHDLVIPFERSTC